MPGINANMSLLPTSEAPNLQNQESSQPQPRQPLSLQGLLRFSVEASRAENAPYNAELLPMDEERKKFLENALKSMTVDVVEILQRQVYLLKSVEGLEVHGDNTRFIEAIETILEYVHDIDFANDFHKIGGFTVLYPCLNCSDSKVRAGGCELLAVLCQHNPYCQRVVLDNKFIPKLLSMINSDDDGQVVTKAVYALSGIVRDNPEGISQLLHNNGLSVLIHCLKSNHENVIIKSTFLMAALCRSSPNIRDDLISLGCIPQLVSIIIMDRSPSHEHVMSLLISILEDKPEAVTQFKNCCPNIKEIIQRYLASVNNKEEYYEEANYCKRLLHMLQS